MTSEDNNGIRDFKVYFILNEIIDKIDCLQRAVAAMRGDHKDFRMEHTEDMGEVKSGLNKLRRNKVWMPRGKF